MRRSKATQLLHTIILCLDKKNLNCTIDQTTSVKFSMNKIIILIGSFAAFLVNSAVDGQLMCLQGTQTIIGGVTSNTLTSSQCPSGTAACHIFDVSATLAGQTGIPV